MTVTQEFVDAYEAGLEAEREFLRTANLYMGFKGRHALGPVDQEYPDGLPRPFVVEWSDPGLSGGHYGRWLKGRFPPGPVRFPKKGSRPITAAERQALIDRVGVIPTAALVGVVSRG